MKKPKRKMNKRWVLFHLKEAREQLTATVNDLETNEDYNQDDFYYAMQHLYHHANFAWNTRNLPAEKENSGGMKKFYRRRRFPKDIDMS